MKTGERIKLLRKQKHLSAEDLAAAAKVSNATMYRYERGDIADVPTSVLARIAPVLGTTVDYLANALERRLLKLEYDVTHTLDIVQVRDTHSGNREATFSAKEWRNICLDAAAGSRKVFNALSEKANLISRIEALSDADARRFAIILDQVFPA